MVDKAQIAWEKLFLRPEKETCNPIGTKYGRIGRTDQGTAISLLDVIALP